MREPEGSWKRALCVGCVAALLGLLVAGVWGAVVGLVAGACVAYRNAR